MVGAQQAGWRQQVQRNNRRSYMVVTAFITLYVLLGILIDWLFFYHGSISGQAYLKNFLSQPTAAFSMVVMFVLAVSSFCAGRFFARPMMIKGLEYHEVTAQADTPQDKMLFNIVQEMKIAASLRYTPRVYVADVPFPNAFATGWSEKNAAIVITKPLLDMLSRDELQAVVAHELIHIRNQDIKLISSIFVMSSLILFVVDVMFRSVIYGGSRRGREKGGAPIVLLVVILLRVLMPIITMALTMFLSRSREFLADSGAVQITRQNEPLGRALTKIHDSHIAKKDLQEETEDLLFNSNLMVESLII